MMVWTLLNTFDCSGLLGRTSLRHPLVPPLRRFSADCSGLLGRTSLRQSFLILFVILTPLLFRPSRPDFIETTQSETFGPVDNSIVPAF